MGLMFLPSRTSCVLSRVTHLNTKRNCFVNFAPQSSHFMPTISHIIRLHLHLIPLHSHILPPHPIHTNTLLLFQYVSECVGSSSIFNLRKSVGLSVSQQMSLNLKTPGYLWYPANNYVTNTTPHHTTPDNELSSSNVAQFLITSFGHFINITSYDHP